MHTGENHRNDNRLYASFHLVIDFLDSFFSLCSSSSRSSLSLQEYNIICLVVIQPVSRGAGDDEVDCLVRMRSGLRLLQECVRVS